MSKTIRVIGKDILDVEGDQYVAMSFAPYNNDVEMNDAVFAQTENLADAYAGITEYGLLLFNTADSEAKMDSEITLACTVENSVISADTSLNDLLAASMEEDVDDGTDVGNDIP